MLATFLIEISLAVYVLWRYKLNTVTRIAVSILVALAVFQFAEYNICEGSFGRSSLDWARVGFIAITLLPPLGITLALAMADQLHRFRWMLAAIYAVALAFAVTFMTVGRGMQGEVCLGNYAIFHVAPTTMTLYAIYYYGLLLLGIGLALYLGRHAKSKASQVAQYSFIIGYLAFLLPTTTVNVIDPSTTAGIPSIMCGFAVLLAIIIVGFVLPAHEASAGKKK